QFDVTVEFLLQMANYLTERHTSQLRAQMLKAAAGRGSSAPSPVPGADAPGAHPATAEPMRRTNSGAGRAPSALSMRKETATPLAKNLAEASGAAAGPSVRTAFPSRPGSTRNSSANTPVPSQNPPSSRPGTATRTSDPPRRPLSHLQNTAAHQQQRLEQQDNTGAPPSPAASTSSSPSSSSESLVESRIIRRPPRFTKPKDVRGGGNSDRPAGDDDDDDDVEAAFLPPQKHQVDSAPSPVGGSQDLGATLRGDMRHLVGRRGGDANQSQTSDSSVSSAAIVSPPPATAGARAGAGAGAGETAGRRATSTRQGLQGPLSPRRTAELAGRGPGQGGAKGRGTSREGSDGTPSMGSSFSDLDDASVTQSALEEALASGMQDGTIGSRMSVIGGTIGHALRSRYLPKSNRH
ncbi:uncharacterized protein THITE_37358, partial [Thermothielavioides terrestris NRRL 8126]